MKHRVSKTVETAWRRLARVQTVAFAVKARDGSGRGRGRVRKTKPSPNVLCLREAGHWYWNGQPLPYRNTYRWTRRDDGLDLAHERRGNPVPLVRLVPQRGDLYAAAPHRCRSDTYAAHLRVTARLLLRWSVRGPAKRATIRRRYA